MAKSELLRYDKAVALSKRFKRNILPMAKFEQIRYDKTCRLVETLKKEYFAMAKSERLRYNITRFMERCPSGLRSWS